MRMMGWLQDTYTKTWHVARLVYVGVGRRAVGLCGIRLDVPEEGLRFETGGISSIDCESCRALILAERRALAAQIAEARKKIVVNVVEALR